MRPVQARYEDGRDDALALSAAAGAAWAATAMLLVACGGDVAVDAGAGAGIGSSSGSASGGAAAMSCDDINAEYMKQFEQARLCAPEQGAAECTLQVDDQQYCPCPRLVNPANATAVSRLKDLQAAWVAKSCPAVAPNCDGGICPVADGGICAPQPQGSSAPGLCQN